MKEITMKYMGKDDWADILIKRTMGLTGNLPT